MNYQDKIENFIENSEYFVYEIENINEYNARQFEVELYDEIKEDSFFLDFNFYENTVCEIIPDTRQRVAFQSIVK
jgi:nitrogenase subunit NifH